MKKFIWEIIKSKSQDHWLEVKGDDGSRVYLKNEKSKPIYPYHAVCKFDGCVHFYAYSNGLGYGHKCTPNEDKCMCLEEYRHICDIDAEIEMLQELKKTAQQFFKGKTGEDYWK